MTDLYSLINRGGRMPEEIVALGTGGWVGFALMVVMGGVFAFRKLFHSDMLSASHSRSTVSTIEYLNHLLESERREKSELKKQLTESNKEKLALILEFADIKAKLASLEIEVRMLREEKGRAQSY